jgi:outer membrane protein
MRQAFLIVPALAIVLATPALPAPERPLSLEEAIAAALEKNSGIVLEKESLAAARAAVTGAKGAYDPALSLRSDWERATLPVNSAFSGAPSGESSPTADVLGATAEIRQLLPTGGDVSFSAGAARGTTDGQFALLSPSYSTRAGIEIRQPLLRDRAVDPARTTLRVAASDRDRAAASLRREVSDVVSEVESAYWTLVAARRGVGVQQEAVRLAAEQLEETRVRVESGAVPETEIAQPRAELERRRGELLASGETVARAESALKILILGDTDETWSEDLAPADAPDVQVVEVDADEAMERGLRSRPELEAAGALVERRRLEAALAKDQVRPSVDLFASYDRFGLSGLENSAAATVPGLPTGLPDGTRGEWGRAFGMLGEDTYSDSRAGIEFAIPIGNRTAKAAVSVTSSGLRQAEADLARARKEVRAQILDAAAALQTAGQRIEASRSAREAAEIQLASERDRYEAGLSTNFLVLTRQNDLSRARLDEIAALTDYRKARAEFARATGSLLEDRHIEIDEGKDGGAAKAHR